MAEETTPAAEETTATTSPQETETTTETAESKVSTENQESTEETVDIDFMEKDDEGNYVFRVDPDNPESTVYKGKTPKEAMDNARKGFKDKDSYIGQLKAKTMNLRPDTKKFNDTSDDEPVPDKSALLQDTLKQYNVDPKLLTLTPEQWRERESENGATVTWREQQLVEQIQEQANKQYGEASRNWVFNRQLRNETGSVERLAAKFGLDEEFTPEKYDSILDGILSDKKNFDGNNLPRNGIIVEKSFEVMADMVLAKLKSQAKKEAEKEIARARLTNKVPAPPSKTKGSPSLSNKVPSSLDEASALILESMKE